MATDDQSPPDASAWWWHRRIQSYIGIGGLAALSGMAIYFDVSEAAAGLLGYAGMGFLLLIAQYLGSSIVDIVRAWRGSE